MKIMLGYYTRDTGMPWSDKKLGKSPVMLPTMISMRTIETIACLWIILTFSSVALSQTNFYTHSSYGKRAESHRLDALPFFSGSRYGRSDSEISSMTNKKSSDKSIEMLTGAGHFFLGSRYGKRGEINNNNNNNNNQSIDNDERSKINIRSLEAVLNYIYHIRHVNNQQFDVDNIQDHQRQIKNDNGHDEIDKINMKSMNKEKLKYNKIWHWF